MVTSTTPGWFEYRGGAIFELASLQQEKADGSFADFTLADPADTVQADAPVAPTALALVSKTATSATLSWTLDATVEILGVRIYVGSTQWGPDRSATTVQTTISSLTASTAYTVTAAAFNSAGESLHSNAVTFTTNAATVGVPTAPDTLVKSNRSTSGITLTWTEPAFTPVTGHRVYVDGSVAATLGVSVLTYNVTSEAEGTSHEAYVIRYNASGESDPSPTAAWTTGTTTTSTSMLMGCSDSPNNHGGTEIWDGWRVYTKGARDSKANRTGAQRPIFLAYSEAGNNLGDANPVYATILAHVKADLEAFYYSSGDTHSGRWGIRLYWSNGNENSDKGAISGTNHTAAQIANYVTSQRALYDACHYAPGGVRRYPDAYAGSNPTQNHELGGYVADWLHPSAQYHDFVMWSMYPPGRGSNLATSTDPTFTKPSTDPARRTDLQDGFLVRCYYRTSQAQQAARTALGDNTFALAISAGEVGIGDDPNDRNHRPYYACHSLAGTMQTLADNYSMEMAFTCWWDNQSSSASPQNILTDEPTATTPTTREAWQNWLAYNHEYGGTHPATWPASPKSTWPTGA